MFWACGAPPNTPIPSLTAQGLNFLWRDQLLPETNKAIVRQMFEQVWNKRRVDLIQEFYTEDVVQHIAGISSQPGLESVREAASVMLNTYPDLHHAIDDEIAQLQLSDLGRGCHASRKPFDL